MWRRVPTKPKTEWVQCKGQPYPITRDVCKARQKRGEKQCKRCPERGAQMYLFESPCQIKGQAET